MIKRLARWVSGLIWVVVLTTSGTVLAQSSPAASAVTSAASSGVGIAQPSAPPTLYDQTNDVGANWSDSSDYGKSHNEANGYLSSQAADDFIVPTSAIWTVVTVTVGGGYVGVSGTGVDHLRVQFYNNASNNLPLTRIYSTTIASGSISGFNTGVYVITLNPPLQLGPGHYWLSAQALEQCLADNCKHWVWTERTVQANAESAWEQPQPALGYNCPTWKPRVSGCHEPGSSSGNDLLFKLAGTFTPVHAQIFLPVLHR